MKTSTFALILAALSLALAGCGTIDDLQTGVQQQFSPTYHVLAVAGGKKVVFEAARQSAVSLGFHLTSGGPAEGRFEAVNAVTANDTLQGASQLVMKVKLDETAAGTEVSVLLLEDVQSDSQGAAGLVTETPLQESALYGAFFTGLQQAMASPPPVK